MTGIRLFVLRWIAIVIALSSAKTLPSTVKMRERQQRDIRMHAP